MRLFGIFLLVFATSQDDFISPEAGFEYLHAVSDCTPHLIVDNRDTLAEFSGPWLTAHNQSTTPGFYGIDFRYALASENTNPTATYTLPISQNGRYMLSMLYKNMYGNTNSLSVTIFHGGGPPETIIVDQSSNGHKLLNDDFVWIDLGIFRFSAYGGRRIEVDLSSTPNGDWVVIDAFRATKILDYITYFTLPFEDGVYAGEEYQLRIHVPDSAFYMVSVWWDYNSTDVVEDAKFEVKSEDGSRYFQMNQPEDSGGVWFNVGEYEFLEGITYQIKTTHIRFKEVRFMKLQCEILEIEDCPQDYFFLGDLDFVTRDMTFPIASYKTHDGDWFDMPDIGVKKFASGITNVSIGVVDPSSRKATCDFSVTIGISIFCPLPFSS